MAIILRPGTLETETIAPADGRTFQLAELQAIIGGYIEALRLDDGRWMFLNEDGKRLELVLNYAATTIMAHRLAYDDYIVGTVVICDSVEAGANDADEPFNASGDRDP
jgi:hypothetical protein